MPIIHRFQQRSEEWFAIRLGKPTASCFDRIITPKTGKLSASADKYIAELLAEEMWGAPLDTCESRDTQFGEEFEDQARRDFEFRYGVEIEEVGFVESDDHRFGCSPDGLIGDNAGFETKSPNPVTHVGYLLHGTVPDDYKCQIQGSLYVCQRDRWYANSYRPGFPSATIEVGRDEEFINKLASALDQFCCRLAEARMTLISRYGEIRKLKQPESPEQIDGMEVRGVC